MNSAQGFLMSIDPRIGSSCETSAASSSLPASDSRAPTPRTTSARLKAALPQALATGIQCIRQAMHRILRDSSARHCEPKLPPHRVLMYFSRLDGYWYCVLRRSPDKRQAAETAQVQRFIEDHRVGKARQRRLGGAARREELNRAIESATARSGCSSQTSREQPSCKGMMSDTLQRADAAENFIGSTIRAKWTPAYQSGDLRFPSSVRFNHDRS